jgi:hypothetical protein
LGVLGFTPTLGQSGVATLGYKMSWHYFGTRHGKEEWVGAGAIVKRALRTEQLHNPQRKLQDANNVVEFIKKMYVFSNT